MEEILKRILEELQYQTRLMEEIYQARDEEKVNADKATSGAIKAIQDIVFQNQDVMKNPVLAKAMTDMFNAMPKGVK